MICWTFTLCVIQKIINCMISDLKTAEIKTRNIRGTSPRCSDWILSACSLYWTLQTESTLNEGQESSCQFAIIISLSSPFKCRLHIFSMLPCPHVILLLIRHEKQINGTIADVLVSRAWSALGVVVCVCENVLQLFKKCKWPKSFRSHRVTPGADTESLLL